MELPIKFYHCLPCENREDLDYVLLQGLDLRMVKLGPGIWKHSSLVRDFVDAGGKLDINDLFNFMRNADTCADIISILQLFPPNIFIESKATDDIDSFLTAIVNLNQAVEIMDFVFDHFVLEITYLKKFIRACEGSLHMLLKLVERGLITGNKLLIEIFFHGHAKFYDTDCILNICKSLTLDIPDNNLMRWAATRPYEIIRYFYDLGFDFENYEQATYMIVNTLDTRTLDFFADIGLDFSERTKVIFEHMTCELVNIRRETEIVNSWNCFYWHLNSGFHTTKDEISRAINVIIALRGVSSIPKKIIDKLSELHIESYSGRN
jgi:hypothetical protein